MIFIEPVTLITVATEIYGDAGSRGCRLGTRFSGNLTDHLYSLDTGFIETLMYLFLPGRVDS